MRGLVGMRSRASGVARLQAVPALYAYSAFFVRLFTFYGPRDAGRAGSALRILDRGLRQRPGNKLLKIVLKFLA